jgi:hypothetical protein
MGDAWPAALRVVFGFPPSFPVKPGGRLIHCWKADAPLPEALTL